MALDVLEVTLQVLEMIMEVLLKDDEMDGAMYDALDEFADVVDPDEGEASASFLGAVFVADDTF